MPLEKPNHYGHLVPSDKPRWECRGKLDQPIGKSHIGKLAEPAYRGGYAELDRRLSPRYPTTEEARQRRRQRHRYFGSAALSLAGLGIWLGLSGLPYVRVAGFALGASVTLIGVAFAAVDFFTRERRAP